jgi:hypothetical protein
MLRDRKRSTYLRCIKARRRCNFLKRLTFRREQRANGSNSRFPSARPLSIQVSRIDAGDAERPVVESNNNRLRVGSTHPYLATDSGNRAAPPSPFFVSPSRI